mmetsp:Transcript_40304/g.52782  ORF Transcript_40304/g.52782 Transcript_40304/m.52782 type:complete len:90 (+) Transcript_40304:68-337(+)
MFESFTCTVVLSPDDYFVKKKNLFLMSYHGDLPLKDSTNGQGDVTLLRVNEGDQMGEGRPWASVMPAGGEDLNEDYKTFWEFTTKEFKD